MLRNVEPRWFMLLRRSDDPTPGLYFAYRQNVEEVSG